jgi:3D (Asp-Asp-Asp) domain-containing protein
MKKDVPNFGTTTLAFAIPAFLLLFLANPSPAETPGHDHSQSNIKKEFHLTSLEELTPKVIGSSEAEVCITEEAPEIDNSLITDVFSATAYALRGRTASGRYVCRGIIAADKRVLPLGTRVRLDAGPYSGEYLVADTGGAVKGKKIDIWVPSNGEAMKFGRRKVKLTVLEMGSKKRARRR